MSNFILILAAASIGITTFCLFQFLFNFVQQIEKDDLSTDKENFNHQQLSMFMKLALPFSKIFRYWSRKEVFADNCAALDVKLNMAGLGYTIGASDFLAIKFYYYTVGVLVFFLCWRINQALFGVIMGVLLGVYPILYLNAAIKARHLSIMKALPNMLDLLTLSVEAGKDFISSLRDILAKRRSDALNEEFSQAFQEIQLGRKRSEALRDMSKRVGQSDLTSVINAIIQAEELGVSIADLLRIQGEMLRNKRFTLAEKLANEAPVKIIFPIILFIFPAVMIVLFGPILMQALNMF